MDGTCQTVASKGKIEVTSYQNVVAESIPQLKAAIMQGPTSVTVEADTAPFQMYSSGILNDASCGTSLDHAIAAVGYGVENGVGFYIVRNSWGADWGEEGYLRMAEVKGDGICGIQMESLYPATKTD